jgi:hypothetical protein
VISDMRVVDSAHLRPSLQEILSLIHDSVAGCAVPVRQSVRPMARIFHDVSMRRLLRRACLVRPPQAHFFRVAALLPGAVGSPREVAVIP